MTSWSPTSTVSHNSNYNSKHIAPTTALMHCKAKNNSAVITVAAAAVTTTGAAGRARRRHDYEQTISVTTSAATTTARRCKQKLQPRQAIYLLFVYTLGRDKTRSPVMLFPRRPLPNKNLWCTGGGLGIFSIYPIISSILLRIIRVFERMFSVFAGMLSLFAEIFSVFPWILRAFPMVHRICKDFVCSSKGFVRMSKFARMFCIFPKAATWL